ncbi:MAG: hypothetical protein KDA65_17770, partial [Planctomycetaceae bacterium]|nr:hypothetical protein [Planctomycetaceae bacterium]
GLHTVYNLEIQAAHVYHVGEGGVLVHNICAEHVRRIKELKAAGLRDDEIRAVIKPNNASPLFEAPSNTRALTVGSKVKLRINSSRYTDAERQMIQLAIDESNIRFASRAETSIIGEKVPFSSYKSRRYIRDRFFPDRPVSQVKVSDADELFGFTVNVDEIVPRQVGGQQVFANQRVLSERVNKALGPIEERALRNQPDGMHLQGFYIEWY